jgi:acylphosphatase
MLYFYIKSTQMKRLKIKISGRVQGVAFRHKAQVKARELGIKGFIKNLEDDSVYIEAEARETELNEFVLWCRQGPDPARVEDIETEVIAVKNDGDFRIRY